MKEFLNSVIKEASTIKSAMHLDMKSVVDVKKLLKTKQGTYNDRAYNVLISGIIIQCIVGLIVTYLPAIAIGSITIEGVLNTLKLVLIGVVATFIIGYLFKKLKAEQIIFIMYAIAMWAIILLGAISVGACGNVLKSSASALEAGVASFYTLCIFVEFILNSFVAIFFCGTILRAVDKSNDTSEVLIEIKEEQVGTDRDAQAEETI